MRAEITVALLTVALSWGGAASARPPRQAGQPDPLATRQWRVGQGPPKATVVYLHGSNGIPDSPLARRLIDAFDRRGDCYRVVAPWLRPVRQNSSGEVVSAGCATMSGQLQCARSVLRQEQAPVVLMGHSFGGKAALQLAREFPDKVSCVVGLAPSVNMLYAYYKHLTGERGLPDDPGVIRRQLDRHQGRLTAQLAAASRAGDHRAITRAQDALDYHTTMTDLVQFQEPRVESGVRTPTLVLHGTEDQAVSIHYIRRFADRARNPGVQLTELPGLDHSFVKHRQSMLGRPVVDQRATSQATRQMADRISGFIDQHVRTNNVGER